MMLSDKKIVVARNIVLDHDPFNAHGKTIGRGGRGKFENTFSQK